MPQPTQLKQVTTAWEQSNAMLWKSLSKIKSILYSQYIVFLQVKLIHTVIMIFECWTLFYSTGDLSCSRLLKVSSQPQSIVSASVLAKTCSGIDNYAVLECK